jgi:hypothetical protein
MLETLSVECVPQGTRAGQSPWAARRGAGRGWPAYSEYPSVPKGYSEYPEHDSFDPHHVRPSRVCKHTHLCMCIYVDVHTCTFDPSPLHDGHSAADGTAQVRFKAAQMCGCAARQGGNGGAVSTPSTMGSGPEEPPSGCGESFEYSRVPPSGCGESFEYSRVPRRGTHRCGAARTTRRCGCGRGSSRTSRKHAALPTARKP